jgi:hypothetical protein
MVDNRGALVSTPIVGLILSDRVLLRKQNPVISFHSAESGPEKD